MRIGYLTFGCDRGKSGIGRYAIELLRELSKPRPDIHVDVVGFPDERDVFLPPGVSLPFIDVDTCYRSPLINVFWHQLHLVGLARRRRWDCIFLPAGNRRLPLAAPCATVGVVHDFSALHVAAKYDAARMFYIRYGLPFLMGRLTRIITISSSSRNDIVTYAKYPDDRITTIFHGVDHGTFRPRDKAEALSRLQKKHRVTDPYILYISRLEHPGKNHVRLIRAFELFKKRTGLPHQLVLAGSDWDRAAEIHAAAEASSVRDQILFTGFVQGSEMPDFLSGSSAFVFPSLFEGFGMPLLEAMASGIPLACANTSSLPEVAGDAALLFPPDDEAAMADALAELTGNPSRAQDLRERGLRRAAGFTWESTADQTLEVIRKAVEEGVRR